MSCATSNIVCLLYRVLILQVFSLASLTVEEFPRLMGLLKVTFLPKSVVGCLEIAKMLMGDSDQTKEFNYSSQEMTDLVQCGTLVLPFFSAQVN